MHERTGDTIRSLATLTGSTRDLENGMRRVTQYTIEQFMSTTKVLGGAFSPDEKSILFTNNSTGIFNAYSIPIAGGTPQQLTHSTTDGIYALAYFPTGRRILVSRDSGGKETFQIYALEIGGEMQNLTSADNVTSRFLGESRDGASFYSATNERDPHFFDIYKTNYADLKREMLFRDKVGYEFGCISNDENYIALTEPHSREDSDIYLYETLTKEMKCLTAHDGDICFRAACFDANSRSLYYRTDQGSDFFYVVNYELATGKTETVFQADCNTFLTFSPGGKYRVISTDDNGRMKIRINDQESGHPVCLPSLPDGDISGFRFSRSERLMAFYVKGDRAPDNLYLYDFEAQYAMKLTDSLNPEIVPTDLVDSEATRFRSFDGLEIPCLLWKPHEASAKNKAPAVVWVHGGPGGQTREGYSGKIQFLTNHGYVVLGVNYRGSSGYGKTFMAADNRRHGREPLWDCVEAKRYLTSLDYVDPSKIGIIGASYGGYMVLAALAFQPEEFAVGVDLFGTSNWLRTLESFPPHWKKSLGDYYRKVGDPRSDREMLKEISPLFHADKIVKPLLVLQGANDPRVIRAESDEIVEAVRKKGGIVEYVLFDDEGHGFTRKLNESCAYERILTFLDRYLKRSIGGS
jgi:dipeptidyl aminopeptidase/acylaminoacyl peptidase